MDACFLTSNPIPKTIVKVVSSIKTKSTLLSKRNQLQININKACILPRFSCSLSSYDDEKPMTMSDTDWRSFRARLVIQGHDASPPPSSLAGDKWVHTLYEPEKGCLLVATDKLDGVHIFERTVILLLSAGPMCPIGIILNRPSLMSIKEMKSTVLDSTGIFLDKTLFFGGPLEQGLFFISSKANDSVRSSSSRLFEEVIKGVYYGSRDSVGCVAEMVKRNVVGIGDFRFFDGYCGWEIEQLREEISAGYWTVAACSPSFIWNENVDGHGLWDKIVGLIGPKKVW